MWHCATVCDCVCTSQHLSCRDIEPMLHVVCELLSAAASFAASWRRSRRLRWRAWMTAAAPLSPSSARHRPVGSCGGAELAEPGLESRLRSRLRLESRSRSDQIADEVGGEVVIPAARSAARSAADRLSGARYGKASREGRRDPGRDRPSGAGYGARREGSLAPYGVREGRQAISIVESQPT